VVDVDLEKFFDWPATTSDRLGKRLGRGGAAAGRAYLDAGTASDGVVLEQ
jgi:hypothetical protein